uniref:Secreted protein n=1 Tax=Steinernema glaseri TaxID=37863 RepID=A0A1I8A4N0_9BILA
MLKVHLRSQCSFLNWPRRVAANRSALRSHPLESVDLKYLSFKASSFFLFITTSTLESAELLSDDDRQTFQRHFPTLRDLTGAYSATTVSY